MYKVSRDTLKKSIKHLMVISTIATLLIAAMNLTTTTNANAFNFGLLSNDDNFGSIDTDSLFSCVGAAIDCTNENKENNNVIANNREETPIPPPPEEELGTLTVTKEVRCDAPFEDPAYCASVEDSPNFPEPSDYQISVSANNPNPSTFPGSTTGTPVEMSAGDYTVTESEPSLAALSAELGATATNALQATGDCIPGPPNQNFTEATGTMTPGGSQTCNIINIVQII